ncbi:MAG TPA: citrate/2-methylcitrate synthase [Clostridia bacterium]|nr:citrate/2-methylcitrate synthase [Clostridia bacterium]HRX42231.1 citrate/2-methylcitrate synthase [Clostridia bacterium]
MKSNYIMELGALAERNNVIQPAYYSKYDVKRGLRNANGTGVLVGLTEIGDVHGYIMDEGEKTPVEGRLRYRGIDVEDITKGFLAEGRFGFEETAYLLMFGKLPDKTELDKFSGLLGLSRSLPPSFLEDMILKAPSNDIMNKLARSVLVLYSYDDNPDDTSIVNIIRQGIDLIARFPALIAYGYQAKTYNMLNKSLVIRNPDPELSTAENILLMSRDSGEYTKLEAEILDLLLVLHAEHGGGNNSAFTAHVVASSGTDIYSSIAAAVGSLKGPRHGGANIKVNGMMSEMKTSVGNWTSDSEVSDYLVKVLNKEAYDRSGLIYGIGHAVYTKSDPRCEILRDKARELAETKGRMEEFELYRSVERLSPEVFKDVKKNTKDLCANVDFYSGLVYEMLGIPKDLFTPLFAASRITGWTAHVIEEVINGGRIIRPAYKNVLNSRDYVRMGDR